ncbi:MAG: sugar phosphate isomerase/epimerase family protein [Pirellulales bacterium]
MIPTVSQICCLNSPFETDIEDFAAGHCRSVEIWLTKLETYLQNHTLEDVRDLLKRFEVQTPVASFQGGLLASQGERRSEAWESFTKRLDLCQAVGIGTLVVACDVPGPLVQSTIDRVQQSMLQAAQEAGKRGLRIAVEFQSNSAFGNNLQTLAALVGEVGSPHLGICLDAFHWHCGPSKLEDLGYLNPGNLFHVQLCDVADTVRELATDSQRIMPGEGDIPISALLEGLKQVGYAGTVSLELMNPQLWQIPARQLGEIGMTSLRKLLGQAQM